MYVARFTENPEEDIQRGWSGYFSPGWATLEEAIDDTASHLIEDDLLEEKQQQWVNTWGDKYEDYETFYNGYLEEVAEELSITFDEPKQIYRAFHHYGLSCWKLDAATEKEAIKESKERQGIQWGGFGQKTIGDVKMVAQVSDNLWILECDDVENE